MVEKVIQVITPVTDSQYRLRACASCHGEAVYVLRRNGGSDLWQVECGCGCKGGNAWTRHGAQILWNQMQMEAGA